RGRWKHERRFREVHLTRDRLHVVRRQSLWFREDRELVPLEAAIGEDVQVEVAVVSHRLLLWIAACVEGGANRRMASRIERDGRVTDRCPSWEVQGSTASI